MTSEEEKGGREGDRGGGRKVTKIEEKEWGAIERTKRKQRA